MRILLCAAVVAILLAAAGCSQSSPADVKAELQQQYTRMDAAIMKKNVDDFMACVGPDFAITQVDGKMVRRERVREMMQDTFKTGDASTKSTVHAVKPAGRGYEADVEVQEKATFNDSQGKLHTVEIHARSRDTWKKSDTGWMLTASTETLHEVTRDGQAYKP